MAKRLSKTLKALIAIVVVLVAIIVIITVTGLIADKTISGAVVQAGKEAEMYFEHMEGDSEGNAWHYYAKAMEAAEGIASDRELTRYLEGEEEPTFRLMNEILDNLEIMQYLQKGAQQEYCTMPHPYPEYVALKRAVSITCVKALYDLENGRSEETLDLLFSVMMVGKHVASSPMIISQMVGFALVGRALKVLKIGIASRAFDYEQLEEIAEFLDDMEKHWPMLAEAISTEMKLNRISFARHAEDISLLMKMDGEDDERLGFLKMCLLRFLCWRNWFSPKREIHNCFEFLDNLHESLADYEATLLDATASKEMVEEKAASIESGILSFRKRNFWFAAVCPEYTSMFKGKLEQITRIRLLGLSSSLGSHRLATGGFPEKLVEVAPHLIVDIRTRKPWEYVNYGDSAKITSPGIDGDTMSITVTNMGIERYLERLRRRDEKEESKREEKGEVK